MTTWTFKGPIAALGLMTLTACEAGQGLNLGGGLNANSSRTSAAPLSRGVMAGGTVLIAPSGYCIDQATMTSRFLVMARCDTLGVPSAAGTAPRGLITVSLTNSKSGALPSAKQIATASQLKGVSDVKTSKDMVTFRAQGRIPVGGLSPTHWRGAVRIGGQTAGIAIYGPENGEIISIAGRAILVKMATASIEATPKPVKRTVSRN